MSLRVSRRLRAQASCVALACALAGGSFAKDRELRTAQNAAPDFPGLSARSPDDIIVDLPPLRPLKPRQHTQAPAPVAAKEAPPAPIAKAPEAAPQPAQAPAPALASTPRAAVAPQAAPNVPAAEAAAQPEQKAPVAESVAPRAEAQSAPQQPTASQTQESPAAPVAEAAKPGPVAPAPQAAEAAPAQTAQDKPAEAAPAPQATPETPVEAAAPAPAPQLEQAAEGASPQTPPPVAENGAPAAPPAEAPAAPDAGAAPQPTEAAAGAPAAQASAEPAPQALLEQGEKGPVEVRLADRATMWLPAGRVFLPAPAARKLLESMGRPWADSLQGVIVDADGTLDWVAAVELVDDGFVSDAAKELEPATLLGDYQSTVATLNTERARHGRSAIEIAGWLAPPAYDEKHRLSACVSGGGRFGCETYALGRDGALKVSLAGAEANAERLKGEAFALADTIVYDKGKAYEDINPTGDKAAEYGLADLLTSDLSERDFPEAPANEPATQPVQAPPAAAPQDEAAPSLFSIISDMAPLLLAVLAAALAAVRIMNRKKTQKAQEEAEPAPIEDEAQTESETPVPAWTRFVDAARARLRPNKEEGEAPSTPPAMEAAPVSGRAAAPLAKPPASNSLVVNIARSLRARLARKVAPAEPASAPAAAPSAKAPASNSLVVNIARSLRGRFARKAAPAESTVVEKPVAPVADADESPGSILAQLARRMRKSEPEPAPAADISRVLRARALPGAAPADEPPAAVRNPAPPQKSDLIRAEASDAGTPVEDASTPTRAPAPAKVEEKPVAARIEDDFALVEPGDRKAASAAIDAGRALREARG